MRIIASLKVVPYHPSVSGFTLSVVIPAFNEETAIGPALQELLSQCGGVFQEIWVVDDGSTDGTAQRVEAVALEQPKVKLLRHGVNRGYGASLKTGLRAAQTDFVLTMDADGQHRPQDVLRLWEACQGEDMLVGARQGLVHSQLWRMPGKWLLAHMAQFLTKRKIPDLNSGLRLFRREVILKYLPLHPDGFSFSTTSTITFLSLGMRVKYVPIEVKSRIGKSTVKIKTGFSTIILIFRLATLFNPLKIFLPISFAMFVIGCLWTIPYVILHRGVSVGAMLFLVGSLQIFAIGLISDQISQLRLERLG